MITRTQVSVDDATRQVLDQLTAELANPPRWAKAFAAEIPDGVQEALDDKLGPLKKRLDQVAGVAERLQSQLSDQGTGLNALRAVGLEQAERAEQQLSRLSTEVTNLLEQVRSAAATQTQGATTLNAAVAAVSGELQTLRGELRQQARQHADALAASQAGAAAAQCSLVELVQTLQAAQAEGLRQVQLGLQAAAADIRAGNAAMSETAQQQSAALAQGRTEAAAAQQQSLELQRALQTELSQQQQAMRLVLRRLDELARPWWKKLFGVSGDRKA